jgi:parallel beta-helix repeat protein
MFSIGNTLWLDGQDKRVMGDPAKQSGFWPSRAGMNGHYGALLCTTPDTARCRITGLEFDGGHKPVEMVFFDAGSDNSIEDCYLHDIMFDPAGPPFAAIHSQSTVNLKVLNNKVERTGGQDGGAGVRGIWVPGRSGTVIENNETRGTGHTGIALEGGNGVVRGNRVYDSLVQGTGYKLCYRGSGVYRRRAVHPNAEPVMVFSDNLVNGTVGAGLMLEDCASIAVAVANNVFENCGREGSTFGGAYSMSYANGLRMAGNTIRNCRSVACFRRLHTSKLEDNSISGGSDVIYLEDDCHDIAVNHSGRVHLGTNCSGITQDGQVIA